MHLNRLNHLHSLLQCYFIIHQLALCLNLIRFRLDSSSEKLHAHRHVHSESFISAWFFLVENPNAHSKNCMKGGEKEIERDGFKIQRKVIIWCFIIYNSIYTNKTCIHISYIVHICALFDTLFQILFWTLNTHTRINNTQKWNRRTNHTRCSYYFSLFFKCQTRRSCYSFYLFISLLLTLSLLLNILYRMRMENNS